VFNLPEGPKELLDTVKREGPKRRPSLGLPKSFVARDPLKGKGDIETSTTTTGRKERHPPVSSEKGGRPLKHKKGQNWTRGKKKLWGKGAEKKSPGQKGAISCSHVKVVKKGSSFPAREESGSKRSQINQKTLSPGKKEGTQYLAGEATGRSFVKGENGVNVRDSR